MIVSVYTLISLLFKNPLPGVPLLILYMVYSNMGGRNAEGVYGYWGRPFAIMVRFPDQLFRYDTATNGIFKSESTYFSICSDYSDFNTDLEEEADVNEEGNEDCSAVL